MGLIFSLCSIEDGSGTNLGSPRKNETSNPEGEFTKAGVIPCHNVGYDLKMRGISDLILNEGL